MKNLWHILDYCIPLVGLFIASHGLEVLGAVKSAPDGKDAAIAVGLIVARAAYIYFVRNRI